jgi:two-component system CheB/CheR fusion protein
MARAGTQLGKIRKSGKVRPKQSLNNLRKNILLKNSTKPRTIKTADKSIFPIVGIGASAGGLEAFEQFFSNVPGNSGMAFVVVQHLDPTREGILPELLQRMTEMKVIQASDGLKVRPDNVYVMPSNASMSILKGVLYLFEPVEKSGLRLPIDFFLRSLAEDRQENSIGVILSGMGSDGTMGMQAIKEKSGITAVQDPASAKFDSMPRSAINAVNIDITAPANELPARLASIIFQKPSLEAKTETRVGDVNSLEKIIVLIRDATGNDFTMYKSSTMYRRIERRMKIHMLKKITDYVRFLQENPAEVQLLFKEILIGVTNFFRDPAVWEKLKTKIIPDIIMENAGKKELRAWIPACSSGEEAYSLAIVFKEALDLVKMRDKISLQIFATDIDNDAVIKARKGLFRENIVADVSPERLNRFFIRENDGYRVRAEIRSMITFAPQNVIKDPPFTNIDIITCRNLLIYLESAMQKKVTSLFAYGINYKGVLVLGSAETLDDRDKVFTVVDAKNKIYRCMVVGRKERMLDISGVDFRKKLPETAAVENVHAVKNIQGYVDQLMLQHFSPASVLVNDKGDILYITGHTGKYLEPAAGKSNWNIFAMLREGMSGDFYGAFRKALRQSNPVNLRGINIGGPQMLDVTIQQLKNPEPLKGMILVVFGEVKKSAFEAEGGKPAGKIRNKGKSGAEIELRRTRENLQAVQEEMQTSQEELKSTNEELQSNVEELQSTNEELTTSKEEMQSLNEELQTVNVEMQSKLETYEKVNNDLKNLLNSTDIAVLFIDKDLRITQFTFMATKIFSLLPGDIGRPFTDLTNDLIYPEIKADVREVLQTLVFKEKDIPTRNGLWFKVRIMPYRTADDRIDGLVITFSDITVSKNLEQALRGTGILFKSLINSVTGIIIGISRDGKIIEFNREAERIFGMERGAVLNKDFVELIIPDAEKEKANAGLVAVTAGVLPSDFETSFMAPGGNPVKISWIASRLIDEKGNVSGTILFGR